jgi:VWFA-related protein
VSWRSLRIWLVIAQLALAQQQMPPTFRTGVELVTIEVTVVDRDGKLIRDLTSSNFALSVGGRRRPIVWTEFMTFRSSVNSTIDRGVSYPQGPSRNQSRGASVSGRTILFVVDVQSIRAGEGRTALRNVADYLDKLNANDRVGLVALPNGVPRIDVTTDHERVKTALGMTVGTSNAIREAPMTFGEASGIAHGDTRSLVAYWERRVGQTGARNCSVPSRRPIDQPSEVAPGCIMDAMRALDIHRDHTNSILHSLTALAESLAPLPSPKAIVLVSEGLLNDGGTADQTRQFAQVAERARVSLYAFHLNAPLAEAATGSANVMRTRSLDDHVGFDGMSVTTEAARGTAFRVIARATTALARLDEELSGYYLMSFERDSKDQEGRRQKIDVRVDRRGAEVRARREFTPTVGRASPQGASRDARQVIGELVRGVDGSADFEICLDTFVRPLENSTGAQLVIAAELNHGALPLAAVGYEITNEAGRVITDSFDASPSVHQLDAGRSLYSVAVPVVGGSYVVRLGAMDSGGRRSRVEHPFMVAGWSSELKMGDLLFGDTNGGLFRPLACLSGTLSKLAVRIDVHSTSPKVLADAHVRFLLSNPSGDGPSEVGRASVTIQDGGHGSAVAEISIGNLPKGTYRLTAALEGQGRELARRSRQFEKGATR